MFFRGRKLQYHARPERPDPLFAKMLQEPLGGQWGETSYNVTAESQGRLQVCRLYNMTNDPGVGDMLSFLIARDTMHQNHWLAATAELEEEGFDETPVPASFPPSLEKAEVAYQSIDTVENSQGRRGRWASGPSADGKGTFSASRISAMTDDKGLLGQVDPRTYGTPAQPLPPMAGE